MSKILLLIIANREKIIFQKKFQKLFQHFFYSESPCGFNGNPRRQVGPRLRYFRLLAPSGISSVMWPRSVKYGIRCISYMCTLSVCPRERNRGLHLHSRLVTANNCERGVVRWNSFFGALPPSHTLSKLGLQPAKLWEAFGMFGDFFMLFMFCK